MKTNSQLLPSSHRLTRSRRALMLGAVLSATIIATGCQSTSLSPKVIATNQTPTAAKTALATALQQQRRQSFAYHSNLEINNEGQFNSIDSTQLVTSEYVEAYCEETHDQAYAALIEQAQAQNGVLDDAEFSVQRDDIKRSYLACDEAYQAWNENQYDSEYSRDIDEDSDVYEAYDDAEYRSEYDTVVEDDSPTSTEQMGDDGVTLTETSILNGGAIAGNQQSSVSPYYLELFDNYDKKTTVQNVRNAQLLDAYLLKPLSINAQGVYQPMAGKLTMLGSVQYRGRHHHSSLSQPIYVDAKAGAIYLWADNIAMLNSEMFDDQLGIQWQNKWLKLTLDDGSLPKNFGRTLIKSHFEALDRTYDAASVSQFDYITPKSLTSSSPKYLSAQLAPMLQSSQIIRRSQSSKEYKESYQNYMTTLYDLISAQYPMLVDDNTPPVDLFDSSGEQFTSKAIVQRILTMVKDNIEAQDTAALLIDTQDQVMTQPDNSQLQELYGLDNRGRIQWQHIRDQDLEDQSATNGITIDVLQQYSPITAQTLAYPNLPVDVQEPNASNSVDMRDYSRELVEHYREGGGTAMGKILFRMLPMSQERFERSIE